MWGLPKLTLWAPGPPSSLHSLPPWADWQDKGSRDGLPAVESGYLPIPPAKVSWQPGLVLSVCLYVYVGEGKG